MQGQKRKCLKKRKKQKSGKYIKECYVKFLSNTDDGLKVALR